MKTWLYSSWSVVALLLALATPGFTTHAADGATAKRPAIYDEKADGSKQVAEALALAKKEDKRVLLQFGANWCGWCHKLHELFASNPAIRDQLKSGYVVVLIDVNEDHNASVNKQYDNPMRFGLPSIVILDAEGKLLTIKDSGELEDGDHHDPKRVLDFLKLWARKK